MGQLPEKTAEARNQSIRIPGKHILFSKEHRLQAFFQMMKLFSEDTYKLHVHLPELSEELAKLCQKVWVR